MARLIYSVAINEARMSAIELEVGSNPIMRMYGLNPGDTVPATCEEPAAGYVIAEGAEVVGNWLGVPSTTKVGAFVARANIFSSWVLALQDEGEIKYLRIYDSSGVFCGVQCEVKDVSELPTLTGTQDPETGGPMPARNGRCLARPVAVDPARQRAAVAAGFCAAAAAPARK